MSRTADWVIQKAFLHANRKATPPASGTPKYNALLGIVDSMQKFWEDEPDTEWSSLYQRVTLVPVVTATDTFAIPASVKYLTDREGDYVLVTNGTNTTRFYVISPNQLYEYRYKNACAKVGQNLKFSKAFTSDSSLIGYNITVPAYIQCDDIDAGSDVVQVDNPMWLAYMSAEEFVRTDLVRRNTKDDLLALANSVMEKMKQTNGGQMDAVGLPWQPAGESWI